MLNALRVKRMGMVALTCIGLASAHGAMAQADCEYVIANDWGGGALADIRITNTSSGVIEGWTVNWAYANNSVTGAWNANVSGGNPYTASNLSWNGTIQPGQTVSFGLQLNTNGSTEIPTVTGDLCDEVTSSSSSSSSVPSSSSSSSSSSSVSSSSNSSGQACGSQCNWYGSYYPVCDETQSGWGWEDNQSCISETTCSGQPSPYGVVEEPCSSSSSSLSSSSVSSSSTSSSSSSMSSSSSSSSSSSQPGGVIPNAASNGYPYCRTADSDPDGDGWGWENSYSCVVYGSAADPGPGDYPYCVIGGDQLTLCSSDTGSWGFESGAVCLSESMCPGMGSGMQAPMRENLVNSNANATAESVYDYLRSVWGQYTLSGQQDLTWQDSIDQYQRVINDTGLAPAIMGYDFMNYGMWEGNPGLAQTEEAIAHWDRGGLVTFAWHWRDPDASDDTIGEFYTDSTDFQIPIANGQLDTSSPSYESIEYDIGLIAAELQTLEDAGVPVLWRPLHEASGGWFWWGRSDRTDDIPAAYAQVVLWRHLYNRLTNDYGLDNIIWVWNGQSAAWYPGDDYVDIVSHDVYDGAQNYESQASLFELAKSYPHEEKMVAMSENSNIPDPDAMTADGARWLYFVVWNDTDTAEGVTSSENFWTGEYYNTNAHKVHVYTHERVITLDEMPAF